MTMSERFLLEMHRHHVRKCEAEGREPRGFEEYRQAFCGIFRARVAKGRA